VLDIFLLGTRFTENDFKSQKEQTYTLNEHWESVLSQNFEDVLQDIAALQPTE